MCDLCAATEREMLSRTLEQYLRPGVRIAVKYAMNEKDSEEIILVDDQAKTSVTLSSVGPMCWEAENRGNVVKFPTKVIPFPTE